MSAPPTTAGGLRLVFFGPPGAGKTALLYVLGTAQEQQLQGRLTDVSQGLSGLKSAIGRPSADAVISSFPVTYQPLPGSGGVPSSASAILIDCPGKAAAELLARPWKPNEDLSDSGLAG